MGALARSLTKIGIYRFPSCVNPNVAKAGGLQSPRKRDFRFAPTSVRGEAVIGYRDPLTTRVADPVEDGNLESSSFPGR